MLSEQSVKERNKISRHPLGGFFLSLPYEKAVSHPFTIQISLTTRAS